MPETISLDKDVVEQDKPLCRFEFSDITTEGVSAEVKEGIQQAMTILWESEVNKPTTFKITLCDWIVNFKTQRPSNMCSSYDIETDEFTFAVEATKEILLHALKLPLDKTLTLMAGHEAVHKAQVFRGDTPPTTWDKSFKIREGYWESRHEKEAWSKTVTVFKKIYPNARGYIEIYGERYDLPV